MYARFFAVTVNITNKWDVNMFLTCWQANMNTGNHLIVAQNGEHVHVAILLGK